MAAARACLRDHDFGWVTPDVRAPLGFVVVGVLSAEAAMYRNHAGGAVSLS